MKKILQTACLSLVLLLATGLHLPHAQAQQAVQAASQSVASLEGTTWAGLDSDGDRYEFTFLKGGHLRYTTQTADEAAASYEDEGDIWAQNGEIVIILINGYSAYQGIITGDIMKGKSWNAVEKRWSWEFKKKQAD